MAFVNVYSKIGKLRMVHTGNALGLNQNPNIVNTLTQTLMMTLDPSLNVAGTGVPSDTGPTTYGGTTRTWSQAGSWSNLSLSSNDVPIGSTVDYAALVWDTGYGTSPQPTSAFISTASINFITPDGITHILTPSTSDLGGYNTIALSANVTSILNGVISSGIDRALGKYTVSNIPMSVVAGAPGGTGGPPYVGSGWVLVIFYTHPSLAYQSETLYIGNLQDGTTQTISGFYTPDSGSVTSRVFVQCTLSSANQADFFYLNSKFVCGPNNQANPPYTVNNFLSAVVCDYLGNINYNCSFGNNNVNPSTYNQGAGVKAEYTITNVPAINYVPNATRSTTILSSGDGSSITSFGLEIKVNQAFFAPIKYSDKTIYTPGDTVHYTIPFTNSGGSTATNVVFTDTLPSNLTFVPNTLKINGVMQPGFTTTGATMPNIITGATATVTFDAVVSSAITSITTIPNTASLVYNFISDPLQPAIKDSNSTNMNIITVFKPNILINKTVNPTFADFGSTLTYTIVVNNTDNTTYTNSIFQDTTPNGTTFVPNSFTINGITTPQNPNTPLLFGTLPANSVSTLTFSVTVNNTIPNPNPIPNNVTASSVFTDSFGNTVPSSVFSNTATTQINNGTLGSATKTVTPSFASVNDTLTYTIVLTNNGNIPSTNVILTDTIPTNTTFVANSVKINGVAQPGANPTPPTGISVGTIPSGWSTTVTFNIIVNTIPSPNPILNNSTSTYNYSSNPSGPLNGSGSINSNPANAFISLATFNNGLTKTSNKNFVNVNDTITYTIVFKNTGNVTANNIILIDTIPTGTTFVPGSITLNGVITPGTVAPPTGFNVGTIPSGSVSTVTFNVTVTTIPSPNPIINVSNASYTYTANPATLNDRRGTNSTNQTSTFVNNANLSTSQKYADKPFGDCGDIVTYTIIIPNTGNVPAQNVVFKDTIPNGTLFLINSVTLNGVPQPGTSPSPPTGIPVGNIAPGTTATVSFKVAIIC